MKIKKSYKFIKSQKTQAIKQPEFFINFIGELCIKINISQVLS